MITLNKKIIGIVLFVTLLLSVPLIAMQFTTEVNWTISDFIIAGALLLGTGFLLEFVIRKVNKKQNRIVLVLIVIALLLLIWMELAVGIFGSPFAGS